MFPTKEKVKIGEMKERKDTILTILMILTNDCILENLTNPFSQLWLKNKR